MLGAGEVLFTDLCWVAFGKSTYLGGLSWVYWLKLGDVLCPHLCLLDWYIVEKRVDFEKWNAYPMPFKKKGREIYGKKERKKWWNKNL